MNNSKQTRLFNRQQRERTAGKRTSFYGVERKKIVSAEPPEISLGGPAIGLLGPHVSVGRIPKKD